MVQEEQGVTLKEGSVLEQRQAAQKKLFRAFLKSAIKQRDGARGKKLDYIEGHAVIRRLIDVTSGDYGFKITDRWQIGDFLYMSGELYMPIISDLPMAGVGVARIGGGEDIVKGALTDAIKNAAKNRGVALHLYGEDYEAALIPQNPNRRILSDKLKAMGLSAAQITDESKKRHKVAPKDLTDEQIDEWLNTLQDEKVTI